MKVRDTSSATFSGWKPSSCILALHRLPTDNAKVELDSCTPSHEVHNDCSGCVTGQKLQSGEGA